MLLHFVLYQPGPWMSRTQCLGKGPPPSLTQAGENPLPIHSLLEPSVAALSPTPTSSLPA
jgi:hypothetical protein